MSTPSNKTLAKAIFIFGGAQIITVLASIIRNKVAASTVGAMGLGLSALYLSISGLINNVCNLGLPDSGVQTLSPVYNDGDRQKIDDKVGELRLWALLTGGVAMLITLIFAPLICMIYFGGVRQHLHSVLLLSIVPLCTIITNIETTILKSLQKTKLLTTTISCSALISLAVSVPLYELFGWNAIIFIIVITALLVMLLTLYASYRANTTPPSVHLLRHGFATLWEKSRTMIMLGVTLVITGVGSMGTDLLLQSYFSVISSLTIVGLYKAGYQLSITYPSMIFAATNNDYYPRLAALADDVESRNMLVTKQTRVLMMIVTPCILLFIVLLPWIIPLMLSDEFLNITTMVRIGALSVIVKCFTLPVCFMPLALGKKWDFVQMELISYVGLAVCVIVGCHIYDLTGVGYGILVSNILDYAYGYWLCKRKYGFRYKT